MSDAATLGMTPTTLTAPQVRHGYPVHLEVAEQPATYERVQVLLRVLVMALLGFIGWPLGWVACALYLSLPIAAAVLASRDPARPYPGPDTRVMTAILTWVIEVIAWLGMLGDRFPGGTTPPTVRYAIEPCGRASTGSALLRLVTILPHALALALLSIVSSLLWLVGALGILFTRTCPPVVFRYQRGMLRWMGRVIAYHASLVDRYPPFALDTEAVDPASAAS
ncbi:MAG: DUF4389 domain-containing protein [Deltaproteobacteria bacterium]|nr:DUF4389 domain-containing protein [Deltaproteobacteria bacterium]